MVLAKTSVIAVTDATEPGLWAVLVAGWSHAHEELALSLSLFLAEEEAMEGTESTYVAGKPQRVLWAATWFLLLVWSHLGG